MSAGRIPWEPTGYTFTDPKTGRSLFVSNLDTKWGWSMYEKGAVTPALSGVTTSSSAAKGAARKALETPVPRSSS